MGKITLDTSHPALKLEVLARHTLGGKNIPDISIIASDETGMRVGIISNKKILKQLKDALKDLG